MKQSQTEEERQKQKVLQILLKKKEHEDTQMSLKMLTVQTVRCSYEEEVSFIQ